VRGQAAGAAAALRARRAETPSASQRRSAGTAPGAGQALPLAVGMFTVLPVPPVQDTVDVTLGGRALRLLPAIGAALGLLGWLAALLFWRGHGAGSPLLGGVLWVAVLALLTRGLHLDGLADVADALGSRRPPAEALMIMRRSDIGPFGVAAVVGVLLIQIAAVVTVLGSASRAQGLVVLVAAAVTGRLAALDAARPAIPPARSGGFGALVAGTATTGVRAVSIGVTLLVATVALAVTSTSVAASLWLPVAVLVGLGAGRVVTAQAERRFGGSTGDVFGAAIELATAAMLLVVAGAVAWGWLP
jgi:cobalamin 5'-phosphate synthase/cobalamin synthase